MVRSALIYYVYIVSGTMSIFSSPVAIEPYVRTLPLGIVRTTSYTRVWNAVGGLSMLCSMMYFTW